MKLERREMNLKRDPQEKDLRELKASLVCQDGVVVTEWMESPVKREKRETQVGFQIPLPQNALYCFNDF